MADKAFYDSLPKKRMAAGCLFFDANGDVLLVKPTYKDGWEIPGGVVEDDESPKACCEREIQEELGLVRNVSNLLVLDYNTYPDQPHKSEALMFIFDGGTLSDEDISAITLPPDEIAGYQFVSVDLIPISMNTNLRNRILQAIQQKHQKSFAYLENQQIV